MQFTLRAPMIPSSIPRCAGRLVNLAAVGRITAAINEAAKSAWCREQGVCPAERHISLVPVDQRLHVGRVLTPRPQRRVQVAGTMS